MSLLASVAALVAVVVAAVLLLSSSWWRGRRAWTRGGEFVAEGRVAVVTGAGSGIGLGLCRALLRAGCSVHMVDHNEAALAAALAAFASEGLLSGGVFAKTHMCDVTDPEAFGALCGAIGSPAAAADRGGRHVSLLVNNAGAVLGKSWQDLSVSDLERSLRLGPVAHFVAMKAFLPAMEAAGDGVVVTMASLMAVFPGGQLADYCAAKRACLGLHDSIRLELGDAGSKVHMLSVLPYAVDTGLFAGAFEAPALWLTRLLFPFLKTHDVVDRVMLAVRRKEYEVVLPWTLTLVPGLLSLLLPVPLYEVALSIAGATSGMKTWMKRT